MKAQEEFLKSIELPAGIVLFESGGQTIFPIYGESGGLTADFIAYLYRPGKQPVQGLDLGRGGMRESEGHRSYGFQISPTDTQHGIEAKITRGIAEIAE